MLFILDVFTVAIFFLIQKQGLLWKIEASTLQQQKNPLNISARNPHNSRCVDNITVEKTIVSILHSEGDEAVEQVAQRSGCLIPVVVEGQVGWGPQLPDLVAGNSASGKGVGA